MKYRHRIPSGIQNAVVILLTSGFFLISGINNPSYNWDIVGYVAAAYQQDGLSGKELSLKTYSAIKSEVDDDAFRQLTSTEYEDTVFKDPASLEQQMPFYTIKVFYIQLMRLLNKPGISYPKATYTISAIFTAASVLTLGLFLFQFGVPMLWLPIMAMVAGYETIAAYSTPDAIGCFFALLLIYLFIKGNSASYLISAMLPLVRTDLVILSVLVMVFDSFRKRKYYPILSAAAAVAVYFTINKFEGNYGWLALFNFTFIKITPYPQDIKISNDIWAYLEAYITGLQNFFSSRHIMIYVLTIFALVIRKGYKTISQEVIVIILICTLYTGTHFVLFPVYEDRFFAFPSSLLFLSLIIALFYSGSLPRMNQVR